MGKNKGNRGFTLIELMIVIAIIAIIAAIAIPNLLSARLTSNETAAIAALRSILSAQAQFQNSAHADENNNGIGEYGVFAELAGGVNVRGTTRPITTSVLSDAFRAVNATGEVGRSGYLYKMFLPDVLGKGIPEQAGGGIGAGVVDPDTAETTWCCYAWPSSYGNSGNRTFFVNQGGDVVFSEDDTYSGPGNGPPSNAAFRGAAGIDTITGQTAVGTTGRDGNFWRSPG